MSECVIVLHGLGRTRGSMNKMVAALRDAGYLVRNQAYSSRSAGIEELAEEALTQAMEFCQQRHATRIHFVTHSMGGILVRQYFQNRSRPVPGRVVMLSPPNTGSEVADALKDRWWYRWIMGPAAGQLGTEEQSIPNQLDAIDAEIGVITGNRSSDPWFSPLIPGEDDGKVGVERAKLVGMKDFLVVPYGHTYIMKKRAVIGQVLHFLEHAKFNREVVP